MSASSTQLLSSSRALDLFVTVTDVLIAAGLLLMVAALLDIPFAGQVFDESRSAVFLPICAFALAQLARVWSARRSAVFGLARGIVYLVLWSVLVLTRLS